MTKQNKVTIILNNNLDLLVNNQKVNYMDVTYKPLYQFLDGSSKTFIIPVYQRDYAWKKANCEQLWSDICDIIKHNHQKHFIGTLVTVGEGFDEYSIIDGQQRLTTISIILVALKNHLSKKIDKSKEENNLQEQVNEFLINKYADESKRIRLKPNKQDKTQFDELFENKDINIDNITSNIVSNYLFFLQRIESNEHSPQNIFQAFRKLTIVLINLDRGQDNPQLIFESLNSTGVSLDAGDLIRNYILMDLDTKQQEQCYQKYWLEIERNTNNVADFVRHYLNYRLETSVKTENVYSKFKIFAKEQYQEDKEKILLELLKHSRLYAVFVQIDKYPNNKINTCLARLRKLEFTVAYPYLFDVFTDFDSGNLNEESIIKILSLIESYIFRKLIVTNSTQGFNKLFITLSKEIKKETEWRNRYIEILSYVTLEKRLSQEIPNDEKFVEALISSQIYKLNAKNKNFLLESLENYNSPYQVDLNDLTIEHIMPQTLNKEWKIRLGENYHEIHKKYLHTLGNLTLTAYNSQLSNHDYNQKQIIDFKISKLKLNQGLDPHSSWSEVEILKRADKLAQEAISIWPYPTTLYKKQIEDEQIFDLSIEEDYTHTKPNFVILNEGNSRVGVESWRKLLITVAKFLYDYSPTEFVIMAKKTEFSSIFGKNELIRKPAQIANELYIETNLSANDSITTLNKICEELNYPKENIQFVLK